MIKVKNFSATGMMPSPIWTKSLIQCTFKRMSGKTILALTIGILLMATNGLSAADRNKKAVQQIRIWPLGDSLTFGWPGQDGYRYFLWQLLKASGLKPSFLGTVESGSGDFPNRRHEGHGGYTTVDILSEMGDWQKRVRPDIVLIMIGTNDIIKEIPVDMIRNNIRSIMERILSGEPRARICLASIPPINRFGYCAEEVIRLNVEIRTLAESSPLFEKQVFYADAFSVISFADLYYDGLHIQPGGRGYRKMAELFYNTILRMLRVPSRDEL
jgi:serralysin